jgi:hypothetical protein
VAGELKLEAERKTRWFVVLGGGENVGKVCPRLPEIGQPQR